MVVGFNHNIGYKGELFHVQTEDSGRSNPHIITLLYRGGTILASAKTSYADIVTTDQLELVVESIMKEQHKEMMRRLKNGEFDARIFGTAAPQPAESLAAPQPAGMPAAPQPAPQSAEMPAAPPAQPAPAIPASPAVQSSPAVQPRPAVQPFLTSPTSPTRPAGPTTTTPIPPTTKRSLDEVILDYLITGEE